MATTQNAEGVITCGTLAAMTDKAQIMWPENASKKQYEANVDVLKAILDNQTVELSPLKGEKENTLKLIWLEMCPEDTDECTEICDTGNPQEVSGACVEYTTTCLAEKAFKIPFFAFDTTSYEFEEAYAKGIMATAKALDEKLAQLGVAALVSFGGVNKFEDGVFEGTDFLFVPPQYWGADVLGQMAMAGIFNKFTNPYLISGTQLYMADWQAKMNSGNADGSGNARKFETFPTYYDLFNINAIAGKSTFMVDPNALAFISRNRFSSTPRRIENGADKILYSFPSFNLPNISYDVTHFTVCENDDIWFVWKLQAKGLFAQNPTGCDTDITGVLQFTCGNPDS